ncbi:hypothetical protein WKI65_43735 [Streptomyces sp. MS1.AVA.3]|uniref:hypothetical protein n=1 Tax=Streptomyces decoyicus TaxID=249567 RepID=UPI0030BD3FC8
MEGPAYPDAPVQPSGEGGNAHSIIGPISGALQRAGYVTAAAEFAANAMRSESCNELRQLAMRTVNVR